MARGTTIACLLALLAALEGCGGGSTPSAPTPTPTPAPTPLPPTVVAQRTGFELRNGYIGWLAFPTSRAGILDATVDWTSATNDLNVYLVKGECNYDQLNAGQCSVAASSEGKAKPEKLTYSSPQASTYTIFIDNRGPQDESVSFQVVLSATLSGLQGRTPRSDASVAGGELQTAPR